MTGSLKRTAFTAVASYLQMGSSLVTGILSLKVATTWLSNESLGLWNFLFGTISYFSLLELGFGQGVARLLGEPVAGGDTQKASQLVSTGLFILAMQGILVLVIGLTFGKLILEWAGVPPWLQYKASLLWLVIVIVRGVSLPLVILHGVIWVQNRVYIIYAIGILTSWIGLGAFYLGLTFGEDLLAYTWSIGLPALLTSVLLIVALACNSKGIHIRVEHIKRTVAGEILGFSSAVFMTTLVPQLSVASQSFIAARVCGLDATAVLGVNVRIGLLLSGIALRVFDAFVPRWAATYCHSGIEPVRSEYVFVTRLTLLVGCGSTILLLLCNRPFIEWWTRPDLFGGALLTLVVAISFLFQSVLRILTFPFILIRELKILAWVLVCGLVLELFLQWFLASCFGLVGLVSAVPIAGMLLVVWFAAAGYTRIIGATWVHVFTEDVLWYLPSLLIALIVCWRWTPAGGAFPQLIQLASVAILLMLPIAWRSFLLGRLIVPKK